MSNDKMREDFEAAYAKHCHSKGEHPRLRRLNRDVYEYVEASSAWWAWQASRAAIEVELPKFDGYRDYVVRELQAAFTEAAERQGLKVKP